MWAGAGVVQPSVTPPLLAKRRQPAGPMWPTGFRRVSPSCCYFVVVIYLQKQSDETMRASFASGARSGRESLGGKEGFFFFFFFCGDLAAAWRAAESRSSQRTEGERGRAICGTDMVDECQVVPGADGAEADLILSRSAFSHSDLI